MRTHSLHTHSLWLDCDLSSLTVMVIGIGAVVLLALSGF
jgi:hypothetical protein